ncbi:penicillin-binding protein activator [bacterium]|nr:penicillin-binding protein activator [bacterium]
MTRAISFRKLITVAIFIVLSGCSSSEIANPFSESNSTTTPVQQIVVKAPWEAGELSADGKRLAELLKTGNSDGVLNLLAGLSQSTGQKPDMLAPEYAIMAAYAYLHKRDFDQSLAWFGVTLQQKSEGWIAKAAAAEVKKILQGLYPTNFSAALQRWNSHRIISGFVFDEKMRRDAGGTPLVANFEAYFLPQTYAAKSQVVAAAALNLQQPSDGVIRIGVILPLSGKYAAHGLQVRHGIELALQEATERGVKVEPLFVDGETTPEQARAEYLRLVTQDKCAVVLGPLQARAAESVAEASVTTGIPFITFTKRPNITDLSPAVFQLGATAENQISELLNFATRQLGMTRFGLVSPVGETHQELKNAFIQGLTSVGAELVGSVSYLPGDENSVTQALDAFRGSAEMRPPQAIFVADTLQGARSFVELLKSSQLRDTVLLGSALWDDEKSIRAFGKALTGAYFVSAFFTKGQNPSIQAFKDKFFMQFQGQPELLAAQGYDATSLLLQQISANNNSQQIAEGIKKTQEFMGVTGKLNVEPTGEINRSMVVVSLNNGEVSEATTSSGLPPARRVLTAPGQNDNSQGYQGQAQGADTRLGEKSGFYGTQENTQQYSAQANAGSQTPYYRATSDTAHID